MTDETSAHSAAVHRRDAARLIRWLLLAAIAVAIVVVALDNRHDVRVGYVVGSADAPIWVVIAAAAAGGVVMGWLIKHRPHHRT